MVSYYRSKRPSSVGMWAYVMVVLATALAVAGLCTALVVYAKNPPAADEPEGGPVVATLTASDLYAAYQGNEPAAKSKFDAKSIAVMGLVMDVRDDAAAGVWTLDLGEEGFLSETRMVRCQFAPGAKSGLLGVAAKTHVTVRGRCSGVQDGVVVLRGCSVVPGPGDPTAPPPVATTNCTGFAAEYALDAGAADAKYKGNLVELRGKLLTWVGGKEEWYVVLAMEVGRPTVDCYMPSAEAQKFVQGLLFDKTMITVRGRCCGMGNGAPTLQECVLVK